mmetsp:Transcript_52078/g.121083  ORF Transcript_52078/g.121083 Transcript_52078/m.121083 type:complete len:247 (+) Transcript_52078:98-838(+)
MSVISDTWLAHRSSSLSLSRASSASSAYLRRIQAVRLGQLTAASGSLVRVARSASAASANSTKKPLLFGPASPAGPSSRTGPKFSSKTSSSLAADMSRPLHLAYTLRQSRKAGKSRSAPLSVARSLAAYSSNSCGIGLLSQASKSTSKSLFPASFPSRACESRASGREWSSFKAADMLGKRGLHFLVAHTKTTCKSKTLPSRTPKSCNACASCRGSYISFRGPSSPKSWLSPTSKAALRSDRMSNK